MVANQGYHREDHFFGRACISDLPPSFRMHAIVASNIFLFWDSLTQKKVSCHPGGDWDPWWWVDPKYTVTLKISFVRLIQKNGMCLNCRKKALGGGNSNIFYFHPGNMIQFRLAHIFQMGWFNHQLETAGLQKKRSGRAVFCQKHFNPLSSRYVLWGPGSSPMCS